MAKTRDVVTVRLHFSKESFIEWDDVQDVDWLDEANLSFTDKNGQEITLSATAQAIVTTTKKEILSF